MTAETCPPSMPDSQKTKKSKAKTKRQQELEALTSQADFLDRETAEDVIRDGFLWVTQNRPGRS